ncbi:MAG: VanZ family protein [Spirochaetaceae bacterium]|jgi:VanZ family protein|nr:VanZ family protein [Spirochaetaceae bacterium]
MNNNLKFTTILYNVITLFILLGIIYLSLTSRSINLSDLHNIDKVQHAFAYAVLAFFFSLSIRSWGVKKRNILLSIVFCTAIGGVLEIIQSRYGRMMEFNDFLADLAGTMVGSLLVKIRS